jgi:hypothetical protein
MLEIAAKLPPGVLIGGEERLLAQAVTRSGGARFVAREPDIIWSNGRISGWRETRGAVEAVASAPNTGSGWFDAGPPGALICQEGVNCGFSLPAFAPAVEAFTVAVIYRSEGRAKTLASVFSGQSNNMIFLSESDGAILAMDKMNTVQVSLPLPQADRTRMAILAYDGRSLRLVLGEREAVAAANVPGMDHPADFFIGCRSNRAGLAKTLGQSRLHEVMFWPDRSLPGSTTVEDIAVLAALERHFRWTY